jgi:hypothetical protein
MANAISASRTIAHSQNMRSGTNPSPLLGEAKSSRRLVTRSGGEGKVVSIQTSSTTSWSPFSKGEGNLNHCSPLHASSPLLGEGTRSGGEGKVVSIQTSSTTSWSTPARFAPGICNLLQRRRQVKPLFPIPYRTIAHSQISGASVAIEREADSFLPLPAPRSPFHILYQGGLLKRRQSEVKSRTFILARPGACRRQNDRKFIKNFGGK